MEAWLETLTKTLAPLVAQQVAAMLKPPPKSPTPPAPPAKALPINQPDLTLLRNPGVPAQ